MKIHSKNNKPLNILYDEQEKFDTIQNIQDDLPSYLRDYYVFLRTSVSLNTRIAYLRDIHFFLII